MVKNPRRALPIIVASLIAVLLVAGAYVLSGPLQSVDAASTEALLKAYALKDSDGDQLPDWEEALYGTDPLDPQSVKEGVTDKTAVETNLVQPAVGKQDTITAQFSEQFRAAYQQNYGTRTDISEGELGVFATNEIAKFLEASKLSSRFTSSQVKVSGTGSAAMITYAVAVEEVFKKNTVPTTKDETEYMSDALENGDAEALAQVVRIGAAYTAIANAYIQVPVPKEASAAHLEVANALANMGTVISDMGAPSDDPIRSMRGLSLYVEAGTNLRNALSALGTSFAADAVVLTPGQPGYSVFKMTAVPTPAP